MVLKPKMIINKNANKLDYQRGNDWGLLKVKYYPETPEKKELFMGLWRGGQWFQLTNPYEALTYDCMGTKFIEYLKENCGKPCPLPMGRRLAKPQRLM